MNWSNLCSKIVSITDGGQMQQPLEVSGYISGQYIVPSTRFYISNTLACKAERAFGMHEY